MTKGADIIAAIILLASICLKTLLDIIFELGIPNKSKVSF